mmetsp:Transcript_18638/g.24002  ORF Transcript_18638/g.24002 Transcript_18638/m.24002 type:complete len:439 (+) Transcript_18638:130-1446(+)
MGALVQVKVEGDSAQAGPIFLGWGVYNPESLYRVRILCHRFLMQPQQYKNMERLIQEITAKSSSSSGALKLILKQQFAKAWKTRQALQLPSPPLSDDNAQPLFFHVNRTDTFRFLNGEGDQVSGVAMDVIGGDTIVVMSSAAWCEIHKETVLSSLESILPSNMKIVWKTTPGRLVQDGYDPKQQSQTEDDAASTTTATTKVDDTMILSLENGIQYATFPFRDGQKTGVYCDQRENRLHLAPYCRNQRVLDLCCYHGGFSFNAVVHGGARQATGVDSSQEAVDVCWQNAELNDCADKVRFVKSDITAFMQKAFADDQEKDNFYDVIVLDPPKLAPSVKSLDRARRKYQALNRDAIKLIDPTQGGLLLTCTCSAAMTQKDGGQYFLNMVQDAALAAGREVTLLRVSGAAPCHTQSPISWPASAYLTAALFRVHPISTVEE